MVAGWRYKQIFVFRLGVNYVVILSVNFYSGTVIGVFF